MTKLSLIALCVPALLVSACGTTGGMSQADMRFEQESSSNLEAFVAGQAPQVHQPCPPATQQRQTPAQSSQQSVAAYAQLNANAQSQSGANGSSSRCPTN